MSSSFAVPASISEISGASAGGKSGVCTAVASTSTGAFSRALSKAASNSAISKSPPVMSSMPDSVNSVKKLALAVFNKSCSSATWVSLRFLTMLLMSSRKLSGIGITFGGRSPPAATITAVPFSSTCIGGELGNNASNGPFAHSTHIMNCEKPFRPGVSWALSGSSNEMTVVPRIAKTADGVFTSTPPVPAISPVTSPKAPFTRVNSILLDDPPAL